MRGSRPLRSRISCVPVQDAANIISISCGAFVPFDGGEQLEWSGLAVIDLSSDPAVLQAMTTLESALEYVDVLAQPLPISEIAFELRRKLVELPVQPSLIVLVLGNYTIDAAAMARAVLCELNVLPRRLVAVVTENSASWVGLPYVRGYVGAGNGQLATDATQLTLHLASLLAPYTIICVDAEDWCVALGTASEPAALVRAFWGQAKDDYKTLVFPTRVEQSLAETASAVSVLPLYPCIRIRQTRDLLDAMAGIIREDATFIMSAPCDFVRKHAALSGPHAQVLMLCRPASAH